jgi:hypothetical protein
MRSMVVARVVRVPSEIGSTGMLPRLDVRGSISYASADALVGLTLTLGIVSLDRMKGGDWSEL